MDIYLHGISQINIQPLADSHSILKLTMTERMGVGHISLYVDHPEFAMLKDAIMEAAGYVAKDAEEEA
jgi:hypothetical protein